MILRLIGDVREFIFPSRIQPIGLEVALSSNQVNARTSHICCRNYYNTTPMIGKKRRSTRQLLRCGSKHNGEMKTSMSRQRRVEIIEAMARAAWWSSGEPQPWDKLPAEVRQEWTSYQEAALQELENRIPEVRRLLND